MKLDEDYYFYCVHFQATEISIQDIRVTEKSESNDCTKSNRKIIIVKGISERVGIATESNKALVKNAFH